MHASSGYLYVDSAAGDAELSKIAPALKEEYPEYRIESEAKPDPKWELYLSWVKAVPHG